MSASTRGRPGYWAWNQTFDLVQLSDQAKHFGARLRVVLAGFIELPFDVRPAMGESKLSKYSPCPTRGLETSRAVGEATRRSRRVARRGV